MKRIAVVGGTGFLGRRMTAALKTLPDVEVRTASRRGDLRIDVTRPETWGTLEGSEVIVDVSDASAVPPDALIAWCLRQGMTVVETTSDAPCVERLHTANRGASSGQLVLGGGIFTGVSNLLGAEAVKRSTGEGRALTVGIASSPFSGAGAGTIELMVRAMAVPSVRYEAGQRHETAGIGAGPRLPLGDTQRPTVRASFPEAFMLHQSTGSPSVDVFFAPKPSFLALAFRMIPGWLARTAAWSWFMRAYFTVLRRGLLSSRASSVELLGRASSSASAKPVEISVTTPDGMDAAAWALAAIVEQIANDASWRGVRFVDQVATLQPVLARANALAQRPVLQLTERL